MIDNFAAVVESRMKRLRESPPEDPVLAWIPKNVRLGEGDYKKVQTICRLMPEAFPDMAGSIEWYGYGIADPDEPDVTLDTLLWEQECNQVHTEVPGNNVAMAAQHVSTAYGGRRVVNQWKHSHNNMSAFFSGTDIANAAKGLHSGFHNTKRAYQLPYEFKPIRGEQKLERVEGAWRLTGSMSSDPVISIPEEDVQGLSPEKIQRMLNPSIHEILDVGFYSSVVVTNRFATDAKEYKARIDWKCYNTIQNIERIGKGKEVEIEVVYGEKYKLEIDENALLELLKKTIKPPYAPIWRRRGAHEARRADGSLRTAESEGGDSVWDWLGVPAEIFGGEAIESVVTVLGEGVQAVRAKPTAQDVMEFLVRVIDFTQRQQHNYDRIFTLRDALKNAATEGSVSLEKGRQASLLGRLGEQAYGGSESSIYKIILSDSVISALLAYAETNPRFAELVADFQGNTWHKIGALNRYRKPVVNKNAEPEIKDEKQKKDGGDKSNGDAKPGGWIT
ncbi:MAG: hypothetical protein HYT16_03765 [DPANN group archaeon]|nr:hypothetical protein [DPANN group archaeon]